MRKANIKRTTELTYAGKLKVGLVILIVISITTQLYIRASNQATIRELEFVNSQIEETRLAIESIEAEINALHEHMSLAKLGTLEFVDVFTKEREVLITNYWDGDGSSGKITASGLTIDDFGVNEEGMYTYMNQIVVATANTDRLPRAIYEGYTSHSLYDELTLTFNNKSYQGVVLDVCGKCYGVSNEDAQRYDIFTTDNVIGKVPGVLHE